MVVANYEVHDVYHYSDIFLQTPFSHSLFPLFFSDIGEYSSKCVIKGLSMPISTFQLGFVVRFFSSLSFPSYNHPVCVRFKLSDGRTNGKFSSVYFVRLLILKIQVSTCHVSTSAFLYYPCSCLFHFYA